MKVKFEVEAARLQEAKRRLKLLGPHADTDYDYDRLRERGREVGVPLKILREWQVAYQGQGLPGLVPQEWEELDKKTQCIVMERYDQLGDLANAETVMPDQVAQLAEENGWSYNTARRWVRRYRTGGLWALAPHNNPYKRRRPLKPPRALATLDDAALKKMLNRREILGELADKDTLTNAEVEKRAKEVGVSPRTIRNYKSDYDSYGLAGLAPRERSDKGARHGISDRMVQIVAAIRLSKKDWKANAVYEAACEKARALGESEPSEWQVRQICKSIPESIRLLADGRYNDFRNKYRLTYRLQFNGRRIVYQVDHTLVDVLVKDNRSKKHRTKSEEIRPWLTGIVDSSSRLVMASIFSYDRPDRFTVAAAIRDTLLVSERKPFGGIPDELWVDRGKELLSNHVDQLARELGIKLYHCPAHQPQIKGIVERFFGTLNTRLWSTLPGYVSSNTVERNPTAKATLTISELVQRFEEFIEGYHNEVHSQTGKTPLQYWNEHCFAEPVDPRLLDILLMERARRRVIKTGIKYRSRVYWHTALAGLVGQDVFVRSGPSYTAPDEIQVFHDGQWICTAFATDSEIGLSVTRDQIRAAQQEQKQTAREMIAEARSFLESAEKEIEEQSKPTEAPEASQKPRSQKCKSGNRQEKKPDIFDRLAGIDDSDS